MKMLLASLMLNMLRLVVSLSMLPPSPSNTNQKYMVPPPPPVAATAKATAAFSVPNNEYDDWDLAPLGPGTLGNDTVTAANVANVATAANADTDDIADTGQNAHRVDHCELQVFELLASSYSESEDKFDASEFDDCDGFD
jgi:hypothetical protein